ncbi:head maturation protease, ClpP-related [Segatella copri]|uniref:head maturation protease, ClpP-related n=1 Tax=Segatella copri TaxID=165179 RepID=UPI003F946DE3
MATQHYCSIEMRADGGTETVADVRIYGDIGRWGGVSAKDFAEQIAALDVDQINLYVNSPGGAAWDGVAIMNALRRHRARVLVTVDGLAASAASLICMAGDHITMGPSSQMMVHDASGIAWGNAQVLRDTATVLDKLSDSYADAYAKRASGTRAQWRDIMRAETWYTAEEAVLAGLADAWDGSEDAAAAASATPFDLSSFRYQGRADAPTPPLPSVSASAELPASPEPGEPTTKEDSMSDSLMAGLRERLGMTDADADEGAVLAALDEALEERAEPAPTAALPEGVVAVDAATLADLQSAAADARSLRAERDAERRTSLVASAITEGRIPPARRDHWLAQLNADEEGASAILASLAPNTIPMSEIGHAGSVEAAADAEYARYYPKEETR